MITTRQTGERMYVVIVSAIWWFRAWREMGVMNWRNPHTHINIHTQAGEFEMGEKLGEL